jgi:hypothetical protein
MYPVTIKQLQEEKREVIKAVAEWIESFPLEDTEWAVIVVDTVEGGIRVADSGDGSYRSHYKNQGFALNIKEVKATIMNRLYF